MEEKLKKQVSVMRLALMLFAFVFASLQAFAQREVTGVVRDANGEPLMSAQVKVPGTDVGTITDFDGNYTLTVPEGHNTLEIIPLGVDPMTVNIDGRARVDVNFTRKSDTELDEVVVIGYQTVRKADLVATVASLSGDRIRDVPVASAAEAMAGKLAGVNVTVADGEPDAQVSIRVRGGSSLTQSAEPLYIVDGFPVSSISDISPSDIQSIDVLKDASSAAIYGAQGANGVIIVTTKGAGKVGDGQKFKFNVDYSGFYGIKNLKRRYQMMDARDFALLQYEYAFLTDHTQDNTFGRGNMKSNFYRYFDPNYNTEGSYTPSSLDYIFDHWANAPTTDWQDKTFGRTATTWNNDITVRAGNKIANFTLSYNRIDDEGVMYGSEFTRNNASLKAVVKPINNLTFTLNGRYSNTETLGPGAATNNDSGGARESRVRNAVAYPQIGIGMSGSDDEDDEGGSAVSIFDPLRTIDDNYRLRADERKVINGSVQYRFWNNALTAKSTVGYEDRTRSTDRFYGPTTLYSREGFGFSAIGRPLAGTPGSVVEGRFVGYGHTMVTDEDFSKFQNANTLEYRKNLKSGHNYSLLLGQEIIMNDRTITTNRNLGYAPSLTGEQIFDGSYPYISSLPTLVFIDPNDNQFSLFGKADYNFKHRYYLSATLRADASTRFSKENQWGYFPAAAVAWRMAEEPWMVDFVRTSKMSDLKWRLSYGHAGNNNVDLDVLHRAWNQRITAFTPEDMFDESTSIFVMTTPDPELAPNPNLKWETTVTRNVGVDFGFFKQRLSGTIDLYLNSTRDLIVEREITGAYTRQFQNVGETEMRGAEFSLRGVILDKNASNLNYGLTVDGNIAFNRSKLISLGGMDEVTYSSGFMNQNYLNAGAEYNLRVGEPLGRIWGYRYDGYYTADDFSRYDVTRDLWLDASGRTVSTPLAPQRAGITTLANHGPAMPGMMKLKDLDGVAGITAGDMTVIGNTMPLFTGGFSISGNIGGKKWGNIDVAANFAYSYGNDVINLTRLDLTTIHNRVRRQNRLEDVAYGNRYSMFTADGHFIPDDYTPGANGQITGDQYELLKADLAERNAGADIYNPVTTGSIALTDNIVEDGSFLRLSTLTIGYSLPNQWIKKVRLTTARVFFSANNLFLWTNYSGQDPEVSIGASDNPLITGMDWSAYPRTRAFNFGVNLSF